MYTYVASYFKKNLQPTRVFIYADSTEEALAKLRQYPDFYELDSIERW